MNNSDKLVCKNNICVDSRGINVKDTISNHVYNEEKVKELHRSVYYFYDLKTEKFYEIKKENYENFKKLKGCLFQVRFRYNITGLNKVIKHTLSIWVFMVFQKYTSKVIKQDPDFSDNVGLTLETPFAFEMVTTIKDNNVKKLDLHKSKRVYDKTFNFDMVKFDKFVKDFYKKLNKIPLSFIVEQKFYKNTYEKLLYLIYNKSIQLDKDIFNIIRYA